MAPTAADDEPRAGQEIRDISLQILHKTAIPKHLALKGEINRLQAVLIDFFNREILNRQSGENINSFNLLNTGMHGTLNLR